MIIRGTLRVPLTVFRGVAAINSMPWRKARSKAERYSVTTDDDWTLSLYRVRRSERPVNGPVLLQHGLGASSYCYHFPGRSMADYLAGHGFDVWVSDLRGRGENRGPKGRNRYDWESDNYLDFDIPSFIKKIKEETGYQQIQMAGHSMGGVLLYMYGIKYGTDVFSGCITTASSLDYKAGESGFTKLLSMKKHLSKLPWVPFGTWCRFITPMVGRFKTRVEAFNYNPDNVSGDIARLWYANVFQDISPGVLRRLATTFEQGGFSSKDGFEFTKNAGQFKAPLLAIGGDVDQQVSTSAIKNTVETLGSEKTKIQFIGPEYGHKNSYGHADLLMGDQAHEEVWPVLLKWLQDHKPEK
ncbi:MAG: alpha/beta hydrolase [Planctomycetota bacterium]|nr:alpha/beta hydrolase [Planctomycetota bacterium]